ncbi:MAG: hypothetical protein IMF11_02790 [Proteobacteria bacterium]|nr:hypothetical protein [Pseudomonadota bacterium]
MRREVPLVLTAMVGLTMIIAHFIPPLNILKDLFEDWFFIIAAFAIYLGVLNLLRINADKIYKKQRDWPFGAVVIFGFLVITIPGLFFSGGRSFSEMGTPFYYLYIHVYYPLSATMFALLAFFVASASYRAFRARNVEATLLLVAAFVLMLGRVPIGDWITAWLPEGYRLGNAADWIMDFPQTAGQRAIMIGIALGLVSSALRVILGLERAIGGE